MLSEDNDAMSYKRCVLNKCESTANVIYSTLECNDYKSLANYNDLSMVSFYLETAAGVEFDICADDDDLDDENYEDIIEFSLFGVLPWEIILMFTRSYYDQAISDYFVWNYVDKSTLLSLKDRCVLDKMERVLNSIKDTNTHELFYRIYRCTKELVELDTLYLNDFDIMKLHLINIICSTWDLWDETNSLKPDYCKNDYSSRFTSISDSTYHYYEKMPPEVPYNFRPYSWCSTTNPYKIIIDKYPYAFIGGIQEFLC